MDGLLERLNAGEILVSDGATGTYLQGKGLGIGVAPETWNLSHPDVVRGMARDYFEAGADLVETNTFGGNRYRLAHSGLEGEVVEINRTAAELARGGAPEGGLVVGSVGPTGEFLTPLGLVTPEELTEAYEEQVVALADAGVDGFCVETMTAMEEAALAIAAAASTGLPVVATMTFDKGSKGYATSMGVTIAQAVEGLREAGADVVGTNCGNGVAGMVEIVDEMGQEAGGPLIVQSNAGLPVMRDGQVVYEETPDAMATRYADLIRGGARILGGCCGTGPDHIRAFVEVARRGAA